MSAVKMAGNVNESPVAIEAEDQIKQESKHRGWSGSIYCRTHLATVSSSHTLPQISIKNETIAYDMNASDVDNLICPINVKHEPGENHSSIPLESGHAGAEAVVKGSPVNMEGLYLAGNNVTYKVNSQKKDTKQGKYECVFGAH